MFKKFVTLCMTVSLLLSGMSTLAHAENPYTQVDTINMSSGKALGVMYNDHLNMFIMYCSDGILASVDGVNWEQKTTYGSTMEMFDFAYGGNATDGYRGFGVYNANYNNNALIYCDEYFTSNKPVCYAQVKKSDTEYNPLVLAGKIIYDDYTGYFYCGAHEITATTTGSGYQQNLYRAGIYRTKGVVQNIDGIYIMGTPKGFTVDNYGKFDAMVWEKVDTTYDGFDWNVYANTTADTESNSTLAVNTAIYTKAATDGKGHLAFTQGYGVSKNAPTYNNKTYGASGKVIGAVAQSVVVLADYSNTAPKWSGVYNGWSWREMGEVNFDSNGDLLASAQWGNLNQRLVYVMGFDTAFAGTYNLQNSSYNITTNTNTTTIDADFATGNYTGMSNNKLLYYVPVKFGGENYVLGIPNVGAKVGYSNVVDRYGKTYGYNDIIVWKTPESGNKTNLGYTNFVGNDTVLETVFGNSYTANPTGALIVGAAYNPKNNILVLAPSVLSSGVKTFNLSKVSSVDTINEKVKLSVNTSNVTDANSKFIYPVDRGNTYVSSSNTFKRFAIDALKFRKTDYYCIKGQSFNCLFEAAKIDTDANGNLKGWSNGLYNNLYGGDVKLEILSEDAGVADIMDLDTIKEEGCMNLFELYDDADAGTYHLKVKASMPNATTIFAVSDITINIAKVRQVVLNGEVLDNVFFGDTIEGLKVGDNDISIELNQYADKAYNNLYIIGALYKDDILVDVEATKTNVAEGEKFPTAEYTFNIPADDTELSQYTLKAFYLEDSLKPL